jgi:uncharacterized protein YceK
MAYNLKQETILEDKSMHRTLATVLALCVSGCGVEVAGTAATAGATNAQAARQAQRTQEQFQQRLDAATQATQQRLNETERASDQ